MPQIKKESIKNDILKTAKMLFLENDFDKTSIRQIAGHTGITPSNLYTYYHNKQSLLDDLVKSTYDHIMSFFSEDSQYLRTTPENFPDELSKITTRLMEQLFLNKETLQLLMLHSKGSCYENAMMDFKQAYVQLEYRSFIEKQKKDKHLLTSMSKHLLEGICDMYFSLCMHFLKNDLSKEQFKIELDRLNAFVLKGLS